MTGTGAGGLMLIAYMAFRQPNKLRLAYLIPKDKAAWLEYLVALTKKKIVVKYLSDKELRKVILRARPSLHKKKFNYPKDVDAPQSLYWNEIEVANWIGETAGYPHLKDAFLVNRINGRKLIDVDASALNKMGLKDFKEIKSVAVDIRNLLGINRPNILRAIARRVPLKLYLQNRVRSGRTYDLLTFKKFCETNGFPYEIVVSNKCVLIPCCCSVLIHPVEQEIESSEESDGSSTDLSLVNAPSVEYLVRNQVVRNRTIENIIENLMERFWDPKYKRTRVSLEADRIMQQIIDEGFLELGFIDPENYTKEKIEFATAVSEELIRELLRCVDVLNDMKKFKEELLDENISSDYLEDVQMAAENFLDNAIPVAASYMLGCYSLENIFKEQPEFINYVNSITGEAEKKTNERVHLAELLVDHIISEAKFRVMAHNDFPYISLDKLRSAKLIASDVLNELLLDSMYIASSIGLSPSKFHLQINELSPEQLENLRIKRRAIKSAGFVDQNLTNIEKKREDDGKKFITPSEGEDSESEWVELQQKHDEPGRPLTAPPGGSITSKSDKEKSIMNQQRLPEGQHDDFSVGHVMVSSSRGSSQGRPRSELTSVLSKMSGQSDRPSSATNVSSKNSNFEKGKSGPVSRIQSEHKELRSQIIPRLFEKNGFIYDTFDQIYGELKENGTVIVSNGGVIGHVAQNGVVYSPTGGVIGKIKTSRELINRPSTRSGYRIGLGPIKADSFYQSQHKGFSKLRTRPATASLAISQPRIIVDGQRRGSTALPSPSTLLGPTISKARFQNIIHGAKVDGLPYLLLPTHSIQQVNKGKAYLTQNELKEKEPVLRVQKLFNQNQERPNSAPGEGIPKESEIGFQQTLADQARSAGVTESRARRPPVLTVQGLQPRPSGYILQHKGSMHIHPTRNMYGDKFQPIQGIQPGQTLQGLENGQIVRGFQSRYAVHGDIPEPSQIPQRFQSGHKINELQPEQTMQDVEIGPTVQGLQPKHPVQEVKLETIRILQGPDSRQIMKKLQPGQIIPELYLKKDENAGQLDPEQMVQGLQHKKSVYAERIKPEEMVQGLQHKKNVHGGKLEPLKMVQGFQHKGSVHGGILEPIQIVQEIQHKGSVHGGILEPVQMVQGIQHKGSVHEGILEPVQMVQGIQHKNSIYSPETSKTLEHHKQAIHGVHKNMQGLRKSVHDLHARKSELHDNIQRHHAFEEPIAQNFRKLSETQKNNLWNKVNSGEAKKVVGKDGLIIGEILYDGRLIGEHGKVIGHIRRSGTLVHNNGEIFTNAGTTIRDDGVVVGRIGENGIIRPLEEKDRQIIGRVENGGKIFAANGTTFGNILEDGRIFGTNGAELGILTEKNELVGNNGIPFGFIDGNGTLHKLDVVPQRIFHNHPKQLELLLRTQHSPTAVLASSRNGEIAHTDIHTDRSKSLKSTSLHIHQRPATAVPPGGGRTYNADQTLLDGQHRQHLEGVHIIKKKVSVLRRPSTNLPEHIVEKPISPVIEQDHTFDQKKLKRREMVQKWAEEMEGKMGGPENGEEQNLGQHRLIRMAADELISDVFQMALTNLLLQAEAGQNTYQVLKALQKIQLASTAKKDDPRDQILWIPNIPISQMGNIPTTTRGLEAGLQAVHAETVMKIFNPRGKFKAMVRRLIKHLKTLKQKEE